MLAIHIMNYERCTYTGKRIFATQAEAKDLLRKPKVPVQYDGRRVKRRMKKRKEKREYYCDHCEGWHVTSKKFYNNKKRKDADEETEF